MNSIIDLAIIGAQKAGTTSLKAYLSEHPDISSHFNIEFDYFVNDEIFKKGLEHTIIDQFPKEQTKIRLIKNVSLMRSEKGIERLYDLNPKIKIVAILREPVSRAYSSYRMEKLYGENLPFSEVKKVISHHEKNHRFYRSIVSPGLYFEHLKMIYSYFPSNQVRIYLYEDLISNPLSICKDIFNWINISSEFQPTIEKIHNQGSLQKSKLLGRLIKKLKANNNPLKRFLRIILPYSVFTAIASKVLNLNKRVISEKEQMNKETFEFLKNYYSEENKKLARLTGLNLSIWNE